MEIERKFLVNEAQLPSPLTAYGSDLIQQGYLVVGEAGSEARVRLRGESATLTVKRGRGQVRQEVELPIARANFDQLWPLTEDRQLIKVRYRIPLPDALMAELDLYQGTLEGLVTVEVEFLREDEADRFEPPAWFGREITDDARYKNQSLASDGIPA